MTLVCNRKGPTLFPAAQQGVQTLSQRYTPSLRLSVSSHTFTRTYSRTSLLCGLFPHVHAPCCARLALDRPMLTQPTPYSRAGPSRCLICRRSKLVRRALENDDGCINVAELTHTLCALQSILKPTCSRFARRTQKKSCSIRRVGPTCSLLRCLRYRVPTSIATCASVSPYWPTVVFSLSVHLTGLQAGRAKGHVCGVIPRLYSCVFSRGGVGVCAGFTNC
jgi:hypothetical protein